MNFKTAISKFITNKIVLNVVSILAALNIIGYLFMENYNAVAYYVVLSVLISFFSKNMIIVLGIPLIFVNLFVSKGNAFVEGLENNDATKDQKDTQSEDQTQKQKNIIKKINTQDAKTKQGLPITPIHHTPLEEGDSNATSTTEESFEVGRGKRKGHDIDYAATIEDAYDQLNQILGSDGIKRLTSDTQGLMKQQMELAKSMESMAPMIQNMAPMMEQAKSLLGGMGEGENGLSGIMDIAKKLSGGLGNSVAK
jgi:hypothetical protein